MMKYFFLLFGLFSWVYGDFIDDYRNGLYQSKSDKIYAFGSIDTDTPNHKQMLQNTLYGDIASQVSSLVSVSSTMSSQSSRQNYQESFSYKSSVTSDDIPLYGVRVIHEKVQNGKLYMLALFDFQKVVPIYLKKDKELLENLQEYYRSFQSQTKLYKKEQLLNKMLLTHHRLQNNRAVLDLIAPNKKLSSPVISFVEVQNSLVELMDSDADNVEDLANILAKRLEIKKIKHPICVEPVSLRDNHLYSEFSYIFKNYFTKSVEKDGVVSFDEKVCYKAKGFYHLQPKRLIVTVFIQDTNKELLSSAIGYMKIPEDNKYLQPYKPLKRSTPLLQIVDEYMKEW